MATSLMRLSVTICSSGLNFVGVALIGFDGPILINLWRLILLKYLEALPEQCPPADAEDNEFLEAWRALPSKSASSEHFFSHKKAGISVPPDVDPCRAASCSLMTKQTVAEKLLKLPRLQDGMVACLVIPKGSGLSKVKRNHIDFWAYSDFDFVKAIKNTTDDAA